MKKIDKNIGFIGCGNMAKAIISGLLNSGLVSKDQIYASAKHQSTLEEVEKNFGIHLTNDNMTVVNNSQILFLAVKPNLYESIMKEIRQEVPGDKIYISIAAGKSLEFLEDGLGKEAKILRTMPNTPAMVSEGMTAICPNQNLTTQEMELLRKILESFGKVEEIEEKLFDAVVAVAGSSPAYAFMFLEAMADGAVRQGMGRTQAYRFAAQALLGSAKLLQESGKHPGELKDMVCSPGGTTIEAVALLEERGFRSAVIEAMKVCGEKSKQL